MKHAKESSHWYTRSGEPAYTVKSANGQERNTTLRDARKLNLVPSVTTILQVAAKPGLEIWKQNQVLLAALTLPRGPNEQESDWLERVVQDSKETGRQAADKGTQIHAAIQSHYEGKRAIGEFEPYVKGTVDAISEHFDDLQWIAEQSFANPLGFGGKSDLYAPTQNGFEGIVLDIKTKEFGPDDKMSGFDEHMMQLAAYRVGLGCPYARGANVWVSRSHPGLVRIHEWFREELDRGWHMFSLLLEFWQTKNNHK
jgi:hypothetical protein